MRGVFAAAKEILQKDQNRIELKLAKLMKILPPNFPAILETERINPQQKGYQMVSVSDFHLAQLLSLRLRETQIAPTSKPS